MSRSRYYPGRSRPRGSGKGEWYDTLDLKRDRKFPLRWVLLDGEREYRDTVDEYAERLDYSWAWKHAAEARYRNHRTRSGRHYSEWHSCGCEVVYVRGKVLKRDRCEYCDPSLKVQWFMVELVNNAWALVDKG